MEIENFLIATIGFGCWNSRRAHSVHEFLLFLGLIVTKHTKSGKKICSYNLELYLCLQQQKKKKVSEVSEVQVWKGIESRVISLVWVWVPGIRTSWSEPFSKWQVVWAQTWKKAWAAEGRLEHSLERAGLFLTGTYAVNLLRCQLFQKPWESFLASHRSYRKWP